MHNIEPDSEYAVVTMLVAVPLTKTDCLRRFTHSAAADTINETLNNLLVTESNPGIFDWSIRDIEIVHSSVDPEEGELFRKDDEGRLVRRAQWPDQPWGEV